MKLRITFAIMIMLGIFSGTSFSQDKQDWKFMHPTPQSNLLRKIKMVNETNWVAVGGNGTFTRTSNSGNNWYFHFFAGKVAATLATTGATDAWFFDANTGIVIGDQGYIGRTVNGGVTFDTTGSGLVPTNSRHLSIWFADANTGYIGSGSQTAFTTRILKTTNAGLNWSVVYVDNSGSTSYLTALGGVDAQTVCAGWQNGTCVRTTNGGTNWTLITSAMPQNPYSISFLNSTTGFSAGGLGVISRTTNAGLNWETLTPLQTDWSYFQVKIVSASEIYLIGDPGYLYKSTDLGSSWSALPIIVTGPAVTFVWYSLDHYGSTYVLSGDYGIVAVSTDGCATWSAPGYFQLGSQLLFDITTVPGTSKYWTVGRPGLVNGTREILYSSNSGANWTPYNLNVSGDFFSISMVNENTGYISGQNNQVMKTTNGGVNWFLKTGPSPNATSQLYTCEFVDENTGWTFVNFATVPGGDVFRTTNGGDNWTQHTTGDASEMIYHADMVDANTGYCVMNFSNRPVYKTTNGGVNWTPLTTGLVGNIKSVSAPDANTVYVCTTFGTSRVAKSTNGGANWTLITLPVAADFTSIDFKDANTGYVGGNSTTAIARTTNGGQNWTFQNTHAITNIKVFVTGGDTAWSIGGNMSILRFVGPTNFIKANVSVLMQAMYDQGTNKLVRRDTVKAYLRNASSPYNIQDSAISIIDSVSHSGLFTFTNAPSGQYYIVADHFNSIETWSKSGGETMIADGSTYNYNFTNAASQAFGNNMVTVGSKWCIYTGDVQQDGAVDLSDIVLIFNDASNFVGGAYVDTDLNADDFVDLTDLTYAFNNSSNFVGVIRP